jgi:hypothetical protein
VKRQPGFLDRGERKAPFLAPLIMHNNDLCAGVSLDTYNRHFIGSATGRIAGHVRRYHGSAARETAPILCISKRPLNTRGRDLEHVSLAAKIFFVELGLDCSRCRRAILDRHFFAVLSLDANVDHRPTVAPTELELKKL